MRHKRKVSTVTSLEEDSHQCNKSDHSVLIMRVDLADDDAHETSNDTNEVDPKFLGPQIAARCNVDPVSDEASKGTGDNVEETEHGCPPTGLCLPEVWEVLEVVCAKDGIDGELGAEGVEIAEGEHSSLRRQDDFHCLFQCRLLHHFVLVAVDDLNIAGGRLDITILGNSVLLLVTRRDGAGGGRLVVETSGSGNDRLMVGVGCSLDDGTTVGPFASGSVVSKEQETQSDSSNQNEGDDERHPPRNMGAQTLLRLERVVDDWHDEADVVSMVTEVRSVSTY